MHRYWSWELFKIMKVKPEVLVLKTKLYGLTNCMVFFCLPLLRFLITFEFEPVGHYTSKWQAVID